MTERTRRARILRRLVGVVLAIVVGAAIALPTAAWAVAVGGSGIF